MRKYLLSFIFALTALLPVNAQQVKSAKTVKAEQATAGKVVYLTTEEFKKKIWDYAANPKQWKFLSDKPCLIDFYTTWCGPCKRLSPIVEAVAAKYDGLIYVYRVDAEKEVELSRLFNVQSYPTLLFCTQNQIPRKSIGLLPQTQVEELVSELLLKD